MRTGGGSVALLQTSGGRWTGPWQTLGNGTEVTRDYRGDLVERPACPKRQSKTAGGELSIGPHYHVAEDLEVLPDYDSADPWTICFHCGDPRMMHPNGTDACTKKDCGCSEFRADE